MNIDGTPSDVLFWDGGAETEFEQVMASALCAILKLNIGPERPSSGVVVRLPNEEGKHDVFTVVYKDDKLNITKHLETLDQAYLIPHGTMIIVD